MKSSQLQLNITGLKKCGYEKTVLPLIILFIIVLMVINYLSYQAPKTKKFITQNKVYTNLNGELCLSIFIATTKVHTIKKKPLMKSF